MSAPKVDVLGIMRRTSAGLHSVAGACKTDLTSPMRQAAEDVDEVIAAVDELLAADREYDSALEHHKELVRRVADGWLEIEFDALRKACENTVAAQLRRQRALERIGGAA
ncbi:hypothetical protein ISP17_11300 [Dyella ginsengisoli]|uniref:Uncharacterized protein n=1 Tax=Dyella ginsengisoli TaxID=363848 RepID=A0ABW8JXP1_9GAMM